jgi:hypothetical protein
MTRPGHLLTLLRADGAGRMRTLAEVITPGDTVLGSLHALALLLNFSVTTGEELVLFHEPSSAIRYGDYVFDGRVTRIVTPPPHGSPELLGLSLSGCG